MKFGKLLWMFDSMKVRKSKWCKKKKQKTIIIQSRDEAKLLYKMATKYADRSIVELGRKYGGSAVVMASAIKRAGGSGRVYSVDSSEFSYIFAKTFISDMGCIDHVTLVQSDTRKYSLNLDVGTIPFVLFDAIHDYGIMDEFNTWSKYIMDGGYMLVHDYGMDKHPGITKAVDEYVRNNSVKLVNRVYRMAVIQKI